MPVRTCKGCGQKKPASELMRLVMSGGAAQEDSGKGLPGRGVYCCRNEQCRMRLEKNKKGLKRAFRL